MTRVEHAERLAGQINAALTAADLAPCATTDPAAAETLALRSGVVLIGPPRLRWDLLDGTPSSTWRLIVATRHGAGGRHAWEQLDALVDAVAAAVDVVTADPGQWRPTAASDPMPAYTITLDNETE